MLKFTRDSLIIIEHFTKDSIIFRTLSIWQRTYSTTHVAAWKQKRRFQKKPISFPKFRSCIRRKPLWKPQRKPPWSRNRLSSPSSSSRKKPQMLLEPQKSGPKWLRNSNNSNNFDRNRTTTPTPIPGQGETQIMEAGVGAMHSWEGINRKDSTTLNHRTIQVNLKKP